ncbi:hypothetical protein UFOVP1244_84 [uncultured Caudovirales phage]|uniref:Uncharacterized protein n=1 Tax=uncultured Caudovirales phage TaxID=2100421 RepID=A0A6J5RGH5_9CAUD|nr:hypothetical protein UFOVP1244_84 [uncultured Caudovirales phage]
MSSDIAGGELAAIDSVEQRHPLRGRRAELDDDAGGRRLRRHRGSELTAELDAIGAVGLRQEGEGPQLRVEEDFHRLGGPGRDRHRFPALRYECGNGLAREHPGCRSEEAPTRDQSAGASGLDDRGAGGSSAGEYASWAK